MNSHSIFYYPYSSFTGNQSPLLKVAAQGTKQALKTGGAALETGSRRALRRGLMAIPVVDILYQQYDYKNTAYTGYRPLDAFLNLAIADLWEIPMAIGTILWEGAKEQGNWMASDSYYPTDFGGP